MKKIFCCNLLKNGLTYKPLSDGTSFKSFLVKQSIIKQRLIHSEMRVVKLHSPAMHKLYKIKLGNNFFLCKHDRKTLGKVISSSQSSVDTTEKIRVAWENNVIIYLSGVVNTLMLAQILG